MPIAATIAAMVFWIIYREKNSWWWIILILAILVLNFGVARIKKKQVWDEGEG